MKVKYTGTAVFYTAGLALEFGNTYEVPEEVGERLCKSFKTITLVETPKDEAPKDETPKKRRRSTKKTEE